MIWFACLVVLVCRFVFAIDCYVLAWVSCCLFCLILDCWFCFMGLLFRVFVR